MIISIPWVTRKFHENARAWIDRHGLKLAKKTLSDHRNYTKWPNSPMNPHENKFQVFYLPRILTSSSSISISISSCEFFMNEMLFTTPSNLIFFPCGKLAAF